MLIPFRRSCDRKLQPFAAQSSSSRRRAALRRRPLLEDLEGRQMLSTFTVMNTNDSGAGSLRQAIISSNDTPGTTNAIYFDIPGSGVQTIEPLSPLPPLTQPVTIDATTQPGYDGQQTLIQIDGSLAGQGAVGLDVTSSASGSSFHGLSITDFSGGGMLVDGASNVAISTLTISGWFRTAWGTSRTATASSAWNSRTGPATTACPTSSSRVRRATASCSPAPGPPTTWSNSPRSAPIPPG